MMTGTAPVEKVDPKQLVSERMDLLAEQTGLDPKNPDHRKDTILWRMADGYTSEAITARAFCLTAMTQAFIIKTPEGLSEVAAANLATLGEDVAVAAGMTPEAIEKLQAIALHDVDQSYPVNPVT